MNVLELYHHSLLLEEGDALHHKPQGGFYVTPGLLLQFFSKIVFQSSHHFSLNSFGGGGETALLVQGDNHMGWEGHLLSAAVALKNNI